MRTIVKVGIAVAFMVVFVVGFKVTVGDSTWNRSDPNPWTNGNIDPAVLALRTHTHLKRIDAPGSEVLVHPWDYFGQLLCGNGIFNGAEDQPPGGNVAQALGSNEASLLFFTIDIGYKPDGTSSLDDQEAQVKNSPTVEMLWMARSKLGDDMKRGNVCGVFVGRSEIKGQPVLVVVGSPDSEQTQFVPER